MKPFLAASFLTLLVSTGVWAAKGPEIDIVGFLQPGQSRATDPLPTARTCDYHDHTEHDHHGFSGKIVIH